MYPDLPQEEFNNLFNRYAHIQIDSSILEPITSQADVIRLPLSDVLKFVGGHESQIAVNTQKYLERGDVHLPYGGVIDEISMKNDILIIRGWGFVNFKKGGSVKIVSQNEIKLQFALESRRIDVSKTFNDTYLHQSGFVIGIGVPKGAGICLLSYDSRYGAKRIELGQYARPDGVKYDCEG